LIFDVPQLAAGSFTLFYQAILVISQNFNIQVKLVLKSRPNRINSLLLPSQRKVTNSLPHSLNLALKL